MVLGEEWWLGCCEDLLKVVVDVVHDNEDIVKIVLWDYDINQFGGKNVRLHLCEFPQYFDLSIHFLAVVDVVENILNELDGYYLVGASLLSLDDLAETASPQGFSDLIVLVDVGPNSWEGTCLKLILSFHNYVLI